MNPVIPEGVEPGEALAATIGADKFLAGDVKLTQGIRDRAAGMDHTIDRMVQKALQGEPEAVPDVPFDYKAVDQQLRETGSRDQVAAFETAFVAEPPELRAKVQDTAGRVIRYLDDHFPRRVRPGIVATPTPPGGVELARFKRLWQIACDPLEVLEALGRGNLSRDMVRAVEDLYPSVYSAMRLAVIKGISRTRARRASWVPSRAMDLQLRVLMQADTITPQLAADIDAAGLAPGSAAPRPQSKVVDSSGLETPGQRLATPTHR